MFSSKKALITIAAAGMIFSMTSCKKSTPSQEKVEPTVSEFAQFAENIVKPSDEWKKEEVNALLAFVPEDTAFVMASTRQLDINHPFVQNILGKFSKSFSLMDEITKSNEYKNEDPSTKATIDTGIKMTNIFRGLFTDFKANAPAFGLNPEHGDAIAYFNGKQFVAKLTVDDSSKLKPKLTEYFNTAKSAPDVGNSLNITERKMDSETWQIVTFDENGDAGNSTDALLESLKKSRDEAAQNNDAESVARFNESIKNLEESKANGGDFSKTGVAIHYAKTIVTMVMFTNDKDLSDLNQALKPAAKPLNKSALGTIDPSVAMVGYLDTVKALNMMMSQNTRKTLEDLLETHFEPACDNELGSVVADYPKITFTQRVEGNNKSTFESVLVYKDKATLNKIKELHASAINIVSDKTQLGIKLNIDVAKFINQSIELASSLSQKTYQCSMLQSVAEAAKDVPALITDPQFAIPKNIASGITGVNIAIDKLDIKTEVQPIEGLVNVTGPNVGSVMPLLVTLGRIPGAAGLKVGGDPIEIDLTALVDMPLKLNAVLTQTDLVAGTASYDVKAVSAAEHIPNQNFLDMSMSAELYKTIFNAVDEGKSSLLHKFIEGASYSFTIGTNDEGLVGTSVVVF